MVLPSVRIQLLLPLLAGVVLHACSSRDYCSVSPAPCDSLPLDTVGLRDGDLVFREGPSPESRSVILASGAQYSHVGILARDEVGGHWTVVHAVPSEEKPELVKQEPLAIFLRTDRALSACTQRICCSDSLARAAARYAIRQVGVPFDHDYSLSDTTRFYCTELVWQSYLHQGLDISQGRRHRVGILGFDDDYIYPVDLLTE